MITEMITKAEELANSGNKDMALRLLVEICKRQQIGIQRLLNNTDTNPGWYEGYNANIGYIMNYKTEC